LTNNNYQSLSGIQKWWLAIRPKTLPAAMAPVLAGWGLAFNMPKFHVGAAFASLFGAIMIQIGTNLINDVMDFTKGADKEGRLGPARVTQTGVFTQKQVWGGVIVSYLLAILAGIYLISIGGIPILIIGVASLIAGAAYTMGPYPLAYIGLADIFVMIFFGYVAVLGTVFAISGDIPSSGWWVATAIGGLIVNILVINNIRDIESDNQAGRKNIPIIWGRKIAEHQYTLLILVAYVSLFVLIMQYKFHWLVLLPFLSFPSAWNLNRILKSGLSGTALNPILGKTAKIVFNYAFLLTIGLIINAIL
jgi:1,4-dihydroxy-2-naphthoate polyprenyltransferase